MNTISFSNNDTPNNHSNSLTFLDLDINRFTDNNDIEKQLNPVNTGIDEFDFSTIELPPDFSMDMIDDKLLSEFIPNNTEVIEKKFIIEKIPPNIIFKCQSECKRFDMLNSELSTKKEELEKLKQKKLDDAIRYRSAIIVVQQFIANYIDSREKVSELSKEIETIIPKHKEMVDKVSTLINQAEQYTLENKLLIDYAKPSVLRAIGKISDSEYKKILQQEREILDKEAKKYDLINVNTISNPNTINSDINNKSHFTTTEPIITHVEKKKPKKRTSTKKRKRKDSNNSRNSNKKIK